MKYFRKDIIKVQVAGSLYKHRLLHGKIKIKKNSILYSYYSGQHTRTDCYKYDHESSGPYMMVKLLLHIRD